VSTKPPVAPLGADTQTASDFTIISRAPAVRFLSRGVQPPSSVYVGVNDDLIVGCATSQTGETVTISYRLLRTDGLIILGQFTVSPPNTRAVTTHIESLAEGFLLSVSCKAAVATTRGQTFLRVFLSDPALGGGQPSYMLMADYVTTQFAPAHPNGRVLAPSEGPGSTRTVTGTVPGAGFAPSLNVPLNARWRIKIIQATLTTSAVAGNRQVQLNLFINGTFITPGPPEVNVPPSNTSFCFCTPVRTVPIQTPAVQWLALPDGMIMLGADQISFLTASLSGTDQWSAITTSVEEWLDNV
jgi:hypothetical protein